MQDTPVPPLFADLTAAERAQVFTDAHLRTLPGACAAMPDPRKRRGQRYDLPFLRTCLVAALLCDGNALAALGRWTRDQQALLARVCGRRRHCTPTRSLYRRLVPRLSVAHGERAVGSWVPQTRPVCDRAPLSFDGKTVRGARTAVHAAPPLLAVSTHTTHATLVQVRVDDTTNAIPVAQELLPHLALRRRVVTADALPTPTALAQLLRDQGAASLCTVKDNHPRRHAELAAYFAAPQATALLPRPPPAPPRPAPASAGGPRPARAPPARGSTPTCGPTLRSRASPRSSGIAQIIHLIRTVQEHGTTRTAIVYLLISAHLLSLSPPRAPPERLVVLIRGPWSVESRHWLRAVTCGEERSRLRSGAAPQIMAAVRTLVLTLIRRTGTTQIAAYRQHLRSRPATALRFLFLGPNTRSA